MRRIDGLNAVPMEICTQKNQGMQGKSSQLERCRNKAENQNNFIELMHANIKGSEEAKGDLKQQEAGRCDGRNFEYKVSDDPNEQDDIDQTPESDCNTPRGNIEFVSPQNNKFPQIQTTLNALLMDMHAFESPIGILGFPEKPDNGVKLTNSGQPQLDRITNLIIKADSAAVDLDHTADNGDVEPMSIEQHAVKNAGKDAHIAMNSRSQDRISAIWQKIDNIDASFIELPYGEHKASLSSQTMDPPMEPMDLSKIERVDVSKLANEPKDASMWVHARSISEVGPNGQMATENHIGNSSASEYNPVKIGLHISEQIVRSAKIDLTNNGGSMTLRLDPPHLGMIHMDVLSSDGVLTAHIYTATETARQILESDINSLREMVHKAGIMVDSINISMDSNAASGWNHHGGARYSQNDLSAANDDGTRYRYEITDFYAQHEYVVPGYLMGIIDFLA